MRAFTADFYKVVGTATCLHDNVVMTRFLEAALLGVLRWWACAWANRAC